MGRKDRVGGGAGKGWGGRNRAARTLGQNQWPQPNPGKTVTAFPAALHKMPTCLPGSHNRGGAVPRAPQPDGAWDPHPRVGWGVRWGRPLPASRKRTPRSHRPRSCRSPANCRRGSHRRRAPRPSSARDARWPTAGSRRLGSRRAPGPRRRARTRSACGRPTRSTCSGSWWPSGTGERGAVKKGEG